MSRGYVPFAFGFLTYNDNLMDGIEDVGAPSTDANGYPIGGEEPNTPAANRLSGAGGLDRYLRRIYTELRSNRQAAKPQQRPHKPKGWSGVYRFRGTPSLWWSLENRFPLAKPGSLMKLARCVCETPDSKRHRHTVGESGTRLIR